MIHEVSLDAGVLLIPLEGEIPADEYARLLALGSHLLETTDGPIAICALVHQEAGTDPLLRKAVADALRHHRHRIVGVALCGPRVRQRVVAKIVATMAGLGPITSFDAEDQALAWAHAQVQAARARGRTHAGR